MNILVLTKNGTALGLAQRLAHEGHQISVYTDALTLTDTGKGLYSIATNLLKAVQECRFIVVDSGNWTQLYKQAKMYNKPIIGASPIADMLNADSVKEYDLGRRLGIAFPKTEIFDDSSDIHPKILEGRRINYFIKYARKTHTCTRPEWLAWAMYNMPANKQIILQECVPGFDISVVGWFNGLNWVRPFYYSSPYSERSGGVMMLAQKGASNRLTERTIEPLEPWLKSIDYKGPVTAQLIVNDTNTYVKRFDVGISAPCVFAMAESFRKLPLGDFLSALAFSNDDRVDVLYDYIYGVEVRNRDPDMHGAPLLGINQDNLKHLFLAGAYSDGESYMVSSEVNAVYTATAFGRDEHEASQRVYRTIREVQFPRMEYMSNVRGRTEATVNMLRNWKII